MSSKNQWSIEKWLQIFVTLVIMLTISHDVFAQTLKGKIRIEVSADTTVFVWGEQIWLYMTIHNLLDEEILIPNPNQQPGHVRLELTDEHGNKLHRGIIPYVIGTTYVPMPPKGNLEEPFSLAGYTNDRTEHSLGTRLLPGLYTAKAYLVDVSSTEFSFRIISATAEQRFVAREIVDKLVRWKSRTQAVQDAKILVRKYENTIYLPNIYTLLLIHLASSAADFTDRTDGLAKYSLEFIEKFPKRPEVKAALSDYIEAWRNMLGIKRDQKFTAQQWSIIENELQKIKTRFPNERMTRYVEKMIRNNKVQ